MWTPKKIYLQCDKSSSVNIDLRKSPSNDDLFVLTKRSIYMIVGKKNLSVFRSLYHTAPTTVFIHCLKNSSYELFKSPYSDKEVESLMRKFLVNSSYEIFSNSSYESSRERNRPREPNWVLLQSFVCWRILKVIKAATSKVIEENTFKSSIVVTRKEKKFKMSNKMQKDFQPILKLSFGFVTIMSKCFIIITERKIPKKVNS